MSDQDEKPTTKPKKKDKTAKKVIDFNALLPDFLRLIPDDASEVPNLPDVTGLSPIEAGKRMGDYYRTLASLHSGVGAKNKARTRALIILGALVSQHASPTLQTALRDLVHEHASPRDLVAVTEVIPWLSAETES